MIIVHSNKKFNILTQLEYNNIVSSTDIKSIKCPSCDEYSFHYHGFYMRNIISNNRKRMISITRIKCSLCNSTHSILCEPMIPYISIEHSEIINILVNPQLSNLDVSHISYYLKKILTPVYSFIDLCKLFPRNNSLIFILNPT